jgi:NDP-sugar pyrophosphorylase family protein
MGVKAVILAGGLGTRLAPLTEAIPKPLLPVGESSVLEIQLLSLRRHGVDRVFIATHHHSELLTEFIGDGSRWGMHVEFSREQRPLGTCGPVSLLRERLDEPFLLVNGDVLTTLDFRRLYEFALGLDADLTVATKQIVTPFAFGQVIGDGDYIDGVQEKPDLTFEILAGIYVLRPALFDVIPYDEPYGIDQLIRDLLAAGRKVGKYLMHEYWLDIGQQVTYREAQEAYRRHFQDGTRATRRRERRAPSRARRG